MGAKQSTDFKTSFSTSLKLTAFECKSLQKKKENEICTYKADIADALQAKKPRLAMIRTENLIRLNDEILALDHLIVISETLTQRSRLIEDSDVLPNDIKIAIAGFNFGSRRVSINCFEKALKLLEERFGKEFKEEVIDNEILVDRQMKDLLCADPKAEKDVISKLQSLSAEFDISLKGMELKSGRSKPEEETKHSCECSNSNKSKNDSSESEEDNPKESGGEEKVEEPTVDDLEDRLRNLK